MASSLATTKRPLVALSIRCTMPGRTTPPMGGKPPCTVVEQRVYQRAVRVAGRGVHHHSPLGLFTTKR